MFITMETGLWAELISKFQKAMKEVLEIIEDQNIDNIPGAKERLIQRFEELVRYLPKDDGELLKKAIDKSISNSFFPRTDDLAEAFEKILNARTHEQDFIINELINGFVASQAKSFGLEYEGSVIDRLIEGFKKSNKLRISDQKFYAMFGVSPTRDPRDSLVKRLNKITDFLGLIEKEYRIERDLYKSEERIVKFYTFPPKIMTLLEGRFFVKTESGETIIKDDFDKNVFISLFLARYAIDRFSLDDYKINGICAIFALILILSFMPKVKLAEDNPILRDPGFNSSKMSVIPKGWMSKDVIMKLMPPTIKIIAYRLGLTKWLDKIKTTDVQKKLHLQSRFLIKDVNKWVLGNLCRVEVPIFVEISNIFQEITVSGSSEAEE